MRVNIYAEEMTEKVEIISKEIDGHRFTGLRFYLELPVTTGQHPGSDGCLPAIKGPFLRRPGDDDSAAVTFWGKQDLRTVMRQALVLLDAHYSKLPLPVCEHVYSYAVHPAGKCVKCGAHD